jgi:hypothetical protein
MGGQAMSAEPFYVIEMRDTQGRPVYLTRGFGDPPRTYLPEFANRYKTEASARSAITRAKKTTPFKERGMIVAMHPMWVENP